MNIVEFIKDKMIIIVCNMILFIILASIMVVVNTDIIVIVFMFCLWFFPMGSYMALEFIKYKNYYNQIEAMLEKLNKKYLVPEMMKEANFVEGEKLNNILKEISRDMHENVKYYKDMQEEYREYIEAWVHEIKTPIASAKLVIENNKNEVTDKIDLQLDRIERFVEQVLYYSRSNNVGKDYIIKQIDLNNIVRNVIKRNYRDFIHKKIKLDIQDTSEVVYSDGKWTEFILNQIIVNSIKYSRDKEPMINIYSIKETNSVMLIIEDNGVGINHKDINRVFEKGFTGDNGRKFSKSTGMGLYLCEKLCIKLGLKISIDSDVQKGTKVTLVFPLSSMATFRDD